MSTDTFDVKANKAWKSIIADSPIYLSMSSKELEKCKNFFTLGYYTAIKDSRL